MLFVIGDWDILFNCVNREPYRASDLIKDSQGFALALKGLGFGCGDAIHTVIGNHNLTLGLMGGAWTLGGICSSGDIALDSKAIAGQVRGGC